MEPRQVERTGLFEGGNLDPAEAHDNDKVDAECHHRWPAQIIIAWNDEIVRQIEREVDNSAAGRRRITCTQYTTNNRHHAQQKSLSQ